jgi:heme oxygenase
MSTPTSPLGSYDLNDVAHIDLETTIASLEGGVTTLNPSTAVRIVRTWQNTLETSDLATLHPVAEMLRQLADELEADRINGAAVADLLLELGEATQAAATEAEDDRLTPGLERLGTLLSLAGRTLGGTPVEAHQPRVGDAEDDV